MNTVEKIKAELKAQKIPVSRMERDLKFGNGYLGQLKKGTIPAGRLQAIANYLGKPFTYFLDDDAVKDMDDLPEEKKQEIVENWQKLEDGRKEESEADSMIRDLQILKDRPDLRALLYVGYKNTPEQVRKLAELMESMNQ